MLWGSLCLVATLHAQALDRGSSDWDVLVYGGRVLLGLHPPTHHFGALHLYAHYPGIQTGPPGLLAAGVIAWAAGPASRLVAVVAILVMGMLVIALVEAMTGAPARKLLPAGSIALALWVSSFALYPHLEDALALLFSLYAVVLLQRRGHWVLVALLLGTAAAAKPWAAMFLPLVLALPRTVRVYAAGMAVLVAICWWLPFVLADNQTVPALAGFSIEVKDTSVLHLIGFRGTSPGWVRPVQVLIGAAAVGLAVHRGRLVEALLTGLVMRLWLDPATYPYYGAGVLLLTLPPDLTRGSIPWWTVSGAVVLFATGGRLHALTLLLWGTSLLVHVLRRRTQPGPPRSLVE